METGGTFHLSPFCRILWQDRGQTVCPQRSRAEGKTKGLSGGHGDYPFVRSDGAAGKTKGTVPVGGGVFLWVCAGGKQ